MVVSNASPVCPVSCSFGASEETETVQSFKVSKLQLAKTAAYTLPAVLTLHDRARMDALPMLEKHILTNLILLFQNFELFQQQIRRKFIITRRSTTN